MIKVSDKEWVYRLALRATKGVGDTIFKNLMINCGSAQAVFEERPELLNRISGVNPEITSGLKAQHTLDRAQEEWAFIQQNKIRPHLYADADYPNLLKSCVDGPSILFGKGNYNFHEKRVIAIVGSRNATAYGLDFCSELIADMTEYKPIIVSGLAYGIDICSHREALKNKIETIGVLAHGLDRTYPPIHTSVAIDMLENGGLLTEHFSGSKPDRENFPKRNRIVAGMAEAIIVVEASMGGGALITAHLANGYNREVFALPGNIHAPFSAGCNWLIKTNKAMLINSVKDLEYILGWTKKKEVRQTQLPLSLSPVEQNILKVISDNGGRGSLGELCASLNILTKELLPLLMSLELQGILKCRPGKIYELC